MAKLKPAGKKKTKTGRPGGAISCVVLVVMGIVLLSLLFYSVLKQG